MRALLLVPTALSLLAVGCGESGPAVGDCTTADTTQLISVNPEVVDCGDAKAKSKLVKEAKTEAECKQGRLEVEEKIFCVQAVNSSGEAVDTSPKVGDCTTGDPAASVSFVKPVDCSDAEAKSKIVEKVAKEEDCSEKQMSVELVGNAYCLEGL